MRARGKRNHKFRAIMLTHSLANDVILYVFYIFDKLTKFETILLTLFAFWIAQNQHQQAYTPMYSRSLERKNLQAFCLLRIFLSGIRTT